MDIFSISLKSMQDSFYRKHTGGRLQPVLDGIKQVYDARKSTNSPHLEVSNLCVTGRNDSLDEAKKVTDWMLKHLDADIPLHYVRFHPDYQYRHVDRTSISFLEQARQQALNEGMRYVYVGNVFDTDSANSYCPECHTLLVKRSGLIAQSHLDGGRCPHCHFQPSIILPWAGANTDKLSEYIPEDFICITHPFRGPVQACHIEQKNESPIYYQFITKQGEPVGPISTNSCSRFMLSKSSPKAEGIRLYHHQNEPCQLFEVYDRAHFPVTEAEKTHLGSENVPITLIPLKGR